MSHSPALEVIQNQPPLPNQHFSSWLRGQTALFVSQIVAVLGFVLFLGEEVYYVSHLKEQRELLEPLTILVLVDYAHVIFITLFILVLIQVLDDNDRGSYRVKLVYERVFGKHGGDYEGELKRSQNQLRLFKRRFLWFWIGMLFLYVFFACQHSYKLATSVPVDHPAPFETHSEPTKNSHGEQEEKAVAGAGFTLVHIAGLPASKDHILKEEEALKKLAFPFVVFVFNNITLLFVYWCFLVMDIPSNEMERRYYKHRNWSSAAIVVLSLLFPTLALFNLKVFTEKEWEAYIAIFDALSGVINAIVLALLVARLDSKLIGLRSWLICILYSYAAVQPLFMVFELGDSKVLERITTSVLIFVFISKIYFFLIIIYALQTGKMLNYLFCFPILRDRAKDAKTRITPFIFTNSATGNHRISNVELIESRGARFLGRCDRVVARVVGKRRLARVRRAVSRWLRSDRPLNISKWLGAIATSYFFLSLLRSVFLLHTTNNHSNEPNSFDVAIDYAQLVVVLLMIVSLYLVRKENRYGARRAITMGQRLFRANLKDSYPTKEGKKQLTKFKEYFLYFWCTLFLLYITLLLDHKHISLFVGEPGSIGFMLNTLFYPFVEFLLGTLNLLFVFWCFVVLQSPAFNKGDYVKQKLLINYSAFAVALVIAAFPLLLFMIGGPVLTENNLREYATVFYGLSGTLSAIVLALLIARMDSKLFRLPNWAIGLLFTYAAIQPLFVAFVLNIGVLEMVQSSVLTAALGFKICFFLIITHSLQSGRALNYIACFPFLRDRVDSIFENQFEVRLTRTESHLFTVSIFKKNLLYYSFEKRLETRSDCDDFVLDLRKRMKDRDAYIPSLNGRPKNSRPHEELGVYWVELRSDQGDLLGESIPFRSEKEAHDLICESIEKIPYCKYNRA